MGDALLVTAVLLTVATGIVTMAVLFYRWKLKRPLELLKRASKNISANDLDFSISYDSQDEMGELIALFENMRSQLEKILRHFGVRLKSASRSMLFLPMI